MVNKIDVTNVSSMPTLDVSTWINSEILNFSIPDTGANNVLGLTALTPLLAGISNRILVVTELYVIVVGATPTYDPKSKDSAATSQDMNKKKDVLYRTLQSLEAARDTVGRMITAMNQSIRANIQ